MPSLAFCKLIRLSLITRFFDVISFTHSYLPSLIEDFREKREPSIAISTVIERAQALSRGEGYDFEWTHPIDETVALVEASESAEADQDAVSEEGLLENELVEIFSIEAGDHLATIGQYLELNLNSPVTHKPNDDLMRALHTLKGSAKMAGIMLLGNLIAAVEKYIRELKLRNLHLAKDSLNYLQAFNNYLDESIPQILERGYELEGSQEPLQLLRGRFLSLHHQ